MSKRKRTNRPKKVKIGYADFKINPRPKEWGKRHKAMGMFIPDNQTIEFDETQNICELPNTVLHEILHGIVYVFDIKFKNEKEEEDVVWKMANGLCTVFRDNPELLDWIQYRIEQDSDKATKIPSKK